MPGNLRSAARIHWVSAAFAASTSRTKCQKLNLVVAILVDTSLATGSSSKKFKQTAVSALPQWQMPHICDKHSVGIRTYADSQTS